MLPKRRAYKWNENSPEIRNHIRNRDMIWESQNGKKTELQEMDRNHLKNCIAKIKREGDWRTNVLNVLEMELIFREVVKPETLIKLNEQRKQKRVLREQTTTSRTQKGQWKCSSI